MTTETSFPVGLGLKFKASKKIDITLESSIRTVNTDKLDAYVRPGGNKDKYGYTFVGVSYKLGKQEEHLEWPSPKDIEQPGGNLAQEETNKKIEELNKKIAEFQNPTNTSGVNNPQLDTNKKTAELQNKPGNATGLDDPRFAELNQRIDELTKKVNELENRAPGTATNNSNNNNTSDGGSIDLQKLNDLNQKLTDLDNKNKELGSRIINMQTSNVTYEGGKPILVSVFFEVNKTNIDKINGERVASAARYLLSDPNANLELVGHADKSGGQKYNELLSERRAKAVQQVLVNEYGINSSRLSISFKGFTEPLSKTNYDVNRRVDFIMK